MSIAPRRRLYLIAPADLALSDGAAPRIERALEAGDIACVRLIASGAPRDRLEAAARVLKPLCAAREAALLLEDAPRMARALRLDGAHLNDGKAYAAARETLGGDAVIGVGCGASRHAALIAGERGADYVTFRDADAATLTWWQEMIEVPCVVEAPDSAEEDALAMLARPADFLALTLTEDHDASAMIARAQSVLAAMAD